jgi:ATP-binding protein involved in chromosome partitioning
VPLLAEVPLVQSIREAADVGRPAVLQGDTPAAEAPAAEAGAEAEAEATTETETTTEEEGEDQ